MKQCIRKKCQKEFEPTKPKQKFCSDKCRTYYSREEKEPTELKFAAPDPILKRIDDIFERLGKIDFKPTTEASYDGARLPKGFVDDEPLSFAKLKEEVSAPAGKTAEQFKAAKLSCESQEEWEALKKEIMESSLPKWLKESIIKYN